MVTLLHSTQTKNHVLHDADLIYADESTLLAATGFGSEDVGKVGLALSEQTFWILIDDSPKTWSQLGGGATAHGSQTDIHRLQDSDFVYANEAALLADTGYVAADVGKVGYATTEQTFWILVDDSPIVWGKVILSDDAGYLILQQYGKVVNALGNQSGAVALNLSLGSTITLTQTGNITFTFTNPLASGIESSFKLVITNDGSSPWTRAWPASVDWPGGVEPTLTGTALAVDTYTFFTTDGGTIYQGFLPGADMK